MTVMSEHLIVERTQLDSFPIPESTDTFSPVPHARAYDLAKEIGESAGLNFIGDRLEITNGGLRAFMQLKFEYPYDLVSNDACIDVGTEGLNAYQRPQPFLNKDGNYIYTVALRGCNDKSSRFAAAAGPTTFICSNQIIHGEDINLFRKHSKYIMNDLGDMLERVVQAGKDRFQSRVAWSENKKATPLTVRQGEIIIGASQTLGVLKSGIAKQALNHWHQPPFEEFRHEQNMFGIHNAFTWAMHSHRPNGKMEAHKKLNRFIDTIDVTEEGKLVFS